MGTLNLRCWRAVGTRWVSSVGEQWERNGNQESQLLESTGNVRGSLNGNALGYVILLAGFALSLFRLCAPACLFVCPLVRKKKRSTERSHGPKKEFPNLGDRNSGELHFPRSEFRLPRALRSSIPHSHPHTKLAGCHLLFLSSKF